MQIVLNIFDQIEPFFVKIQYKCIYSKLVVKSQIAIKIRTKSYGHICPFLQKLTPLGKDYGIGAKWCFVLKTQGKSTKLKKHGQNQKI